MKQGKTDSKYRKISLSSKFLFQIMIFKIPTFILAKLSEKGGKELPLKTEKDRRYAEIAFICMMKNYFYPCNITHKI